MLSTSNPAAARMYLTNIKWFLIIIGGLFAPLAYLVFVGESPFLLLSVLLVSVLIYVCLSYWKTFWRWRTRANTWFTLLVACFVVCFSTSVVLVGIVFLLASMPITSLKNVLHIGPLFSALISCSYCLMSFGRGNLPIPTKISRLLLRFVEKYNKPLKITASKRVGKKIKKVIKNLPSDHLIGLNKIVVIQKAQFVPNYRYSGVINTNNLKGLLHELGHHVFLTHNLIDEYTRLFPYSNGKDKVGHLLQGTLVSCKKYEKWCKLFNASEEFAIAYAAYFFNQIEDREKFCWMKENIFNGRAYDFKEENYFSEKQRLTEEKHRQKKRIIRALKTLIKTA